MCCLEITLNTLFPHKDDDILCMLISTLNKFGIHNKSELTNLSRNQLKDLKLRSTEEKRLADYIIKEFPGSKIETEDIELRNSSNKQKEAEIAELRRQRELLRKEGEEKKKELDRLRAENKAKRESKTNCSIDDDSDSDSDSGWSYHLSFGTKPKSEYDLLKIGIKENQKLIRLKFEMYEEDKKRCLMAAKSGSYHNTETNSNKKIHEGTNNKNLVLFCSFVVICSLILWRLRKMSLSQ